MTDGISTLALPYDRPQPVRGIALDAVVTPR